MVIIAIGTDKILVLIDANTQAFMAGMKGMTEEAKKAETGIDNIGKKAGGVGDLMKKGLALGAGALVGGGLLTFLSDSVGKFQEVQTAAEQFAIAMNTSKDEAGKLTGALQRVNIDGADLVEINAEFAGAIKKNADMLKELNVEVTKNSDGTTNTAATFIDVVDALQEVEDGVKRTEIALAFFGEEGTKQLFPLLTSTERFSELVNDIDFVENSDEAREYNSSLMEMNAEFDKMQILIGQYLVPFLGDLMDVVGDVVGVLGEIPGEVYIAVGAFLGMKKIIGTEIVEGLMGRLGGSMITLGEAAGGTATKMDRAKGALSGLAGGLKGLASSVGPLLAVAAAVELVVGSIEAARNLREFVTNTQNAAGTLDQIARQLQATDNWLATIREKNATWGTGLDAVEYNMEQITTELWNQAYATATSVTATEEQVGAAKDLLGVMGTQSHDQQQINLQTEAGKEAWIRYAGAISGASALTTEVEVTTSSLADSIHDIIANGGEATATWENIATKARDAAEAAGEMKTATELNDIAMGIYATTIQGALEWWDRLLGVPIDLEENLNTIQSSYQTLVDVVDSNGKKVGERWERITDDVKTAGNEQKIAIGNTAQAISDRIKLLSSQGLSPLEITTNLETLKASLPNDLKHLVDEAIAGTVTGKANEVPIDLTFDVAAADKAVADLQAKLDAAAAAKDWPLVTSLENQLREIDPSQLPQRISDAIQNQNYGLADSLEADYNAWALQHGADQVTITYNADGTAALGTLDALTGEQTSTITYNADGSVAQGEKDTLTEEGESTVTYNTKFEPDGYNELKKRKDYLAETVTGTVTLNASFSPDNYGALKERKDYLKENVEGAIDLTTNFDPSYNDAKSRKDYLEKDIDANIVQNISYSPDGYGANKDRKEYLSQNRNAQITINTVFTPDGYNALAERVRFLSQDRTATITYRTNGLTAALAGLSAGTAAVPAVFKIPTPPPAPTPINLVRVSVDGRQLRAVIREELGQVRDSDDLQAAMGVRG